MDGVFLHFWHRIISIIYIIMLVKKNHHVLDIQYIIISEDESAVL